MQYRIKQVVENGTNLYYPQYKKRWLWRRFTWLGGEDGTSPYTVFYTNKNSALTHIESYKKSLERKALEVPKKIIYHYIS